MKYRQQPSDEEIQSYMDFDHLLDSRKKVLNSGKTTTLLKWSVPLLTITGALVWFYYLDTVDRPIVSKQAPRDTLAKRITTAPAIPVDTSANETGFEDRISDKPMVQELPSDVGRTARKKAQAQVQPKQESEINANGYFQAEPATGYPDLYEYLNANLIYPDEALKDSIQGVQTVSFVINTKGKPEQIEVVKSLGKPFENEAKRLIENMPEWKPATLNGKPVASKISLPLTFQIEKIKN